MNMAGERLSRFLDAAFIGALIACGLIYLLRATNMFTAFPGDLVDARFNMVVLEHLFRWITGSAHSLWSPGFFYPFPDALAFSDNHFGSGAFYIIWRLMGVPKEAAFDLWFCIGMLLSFVACIYAIRKMGLGTAASVLGAFIFAFGLPVLAQEGHAQLIYRFPIPMAVLALVQFIDAKDFRKLEWVAIWLALQFLCSIYLGIFLAYLLGAMAFVGWWQKDIDKKALIASLRTLDGSGRSWLLLSSTFAIWLLAAGMLYKYFSVAQLYGFKRSVAEIFSMLPRIDSYFLADASAFSSWVGSWVTDVGVRWEQQLFIGIGPLLLLVYGVVRVDRGEFKYRHLKTSALALVLLVAGTLWATGTPLLLFVLLLLFFGVLCISKREFKHRRMEILALVLLVLAMGTLYLKGSLYYFFAIAPGTNSIRAVSRIILVMLFPVALIAAMAFEQLRSGYGEMRLLFMPVLGVLTVAGPMSFHHPSTSIAQAQARVDALARNLNVKKMRADHRVLLRLYTNNGSGWADDVDTMMLAQDIGVPTFNGYSGNFPPNFETPNQCLAAGRWLGNIAGYHGPAGIHHTYEQLVRRAFIIPVNSDCELRKFHPVSGALPDHVIRNIRVRVVGVGKHLHIYRVHVRIKNNSGSYLPAISLSNENIWISWRFTRNAFDSSDIGWFRRPLSKDIPPHREVDFSIPVQLPDSPERSFIQVTLAQEHPERVAWFQDHGMKIAAYPVRGLQAENKPIHGRQRVLQRP